NDRKYRQKTLAMQEPPTDDLGQLSKCCIAASPKLPFDTLRSIFVGQRAAERDFATLHRN
ncbi:MAG: hypothetical protein ABJ082_02710, partial [Parasphingorhabdus sp.]